jgi:hypothetical protein
MKKMKLFCGILIGFMIFSCSSDDDNTTEENPQVNSEFTINGTEYSTPNGYIFSYIDGTNNSAHAIYLINGLIINNEWYGEACDYTSDFTQGVVFNIRSTSITELEAGTYDYELMTSEPSLNETSISTNIVVTDNCVVSADSIDENQITNGNLIVEKAGNVYTLTFTFQTNDFGTVSGTYVGELQLAQDLSD